MDFLTKFIRSKTQSPSSSQKSVAKIPDKVRKTRAGNVPRDFVQDSSQDGIYFLQNLEGSAKDIFLQGSSR